ncbi:hypothetical protein Tco_0936415 [Tanacetum coccineum]
MIEILKPSSPELTVDCLDDLDYFKYFKNEFPVIVYNDGLTSKSDLEIKPLVSSKHIFETTLSKYDEEERNTLHVTFPDNLKMIKDGNDNTDITQPSGFNKIKRSNKLREKNFYDKTKKFPTEFFIHNIRCIYYMAPLPTADQRHLWLRYQVEGYTKGIVHSYEQRLETIWSRPVNRVYVLDFKGLTPGMRQDLVVRLRMVYTREGQQVFVSHAWRRLFGIRAPLGGIRMRMTWRQFILALGLHTEQEMVEAGFGAYWDGSDRLIPDKGDLRDYWIEISSDRDFLGPAPSYAPEKVTGVDLFYLRNIDQGTANITHLLAQYLFRHAEGRKSKARLSGAPAQAPPPPPPAPQPQTMSQRIERIKEEMSDLRHDIVGLRGVVKSFITEQSRVST